MENIELYCDGDLVTERYFKKCYKYSDVQYMRKIFNSKALGSFEIGEFTFFLYDKEEKRFLINDKEEKRRPYKKVSNTVKETREFIKNKHGRMFIVKDKKYTQVEMIKMLDISFSNLSSIVKKYSSFTYKGFDIKVLKIAADLSNKTLARFDCCKNNKIIHTGLKIGEVRKTTGLNKNHIYKLAETERPSKSGWRVWRTK